jgi:integrase
LKLLKHITNNCIYAVNDLWLTFKTLWSRFKRQSNILEQGQTLYSFRHTGAIEIFKRTGSLTKLQKAMGHSSVNVSLTYLRGLEIAELKEEDMPMTKGLTIFLYVVLLSLFIQFNFY